MANDEIEFIKIILYYKDKTYKSEKLALDDEKNIMLIEKLTESGLNDIKVLSFLKNKYSKMIFSKNVLNESVIELKIYTKENGKKKKIKMINS